MDILTERVELIGITRYVYKTMGRAISDYGMLEDKDRVLVAVSGGLDSLSLLKLFIMRKARIPIDFEIVACFVDTNFIEVDKDILMNYFNLNGIEYVTKEMSIVKDEINCFWCSWNRRKALFEAARENKCNKLALGHNLDDINETTLMNMFFNGEITTMPPKVELFDGALTVIRPLCYIEKEKIEEFSKQFDFPDTQYKCPYGQDSQRQAVKEIIEKLHEKHPFVKKNIFCSLKRIRKDYLV
ncbi:MAG: tRNA 2-thiocytidine(32) synthetase TtcA [Candidatus Omnitrophica bacterium]|jgi:tRNA 2-thiocytidine biosynthesis protein TtcA|nr:tRNA 2-thiocytidine(32) synthetase TtcA [Candidatus Omnitrophota bacterium]